MENKAKTVAEELVNKFYSQLSGVPMLLVLMIDALNIDSFWSVSKQCALIYIDGQIELLTELKNDKWYDSKDRTRIFAEEQQNRIQSKITFWQDVKKEIQSL